MTMCGTEYTVVPRLCRVSFSGPSRPCAAKPASSTEGSNLDAHWIARCDPSAHAVEFSKTAARSHGGASSEDLRWCGRPKPLADRTRQYSAPRGPKKRLRSEAQGPAQPKV